MELERELVETSDYLQSIQEQYEAANEELQASTEEVQSANEELQSINEELANEELTTVNEEMSHRNAELTRLNGDLVNLQSSTHFSIVLQDAARARIAGFQLHMPKPVSPTDLVAAVAGLALKARHG